MAELTRNDEKVLYEAGYLLLQKGKLKAAREVFEGLMAMTPQKSLPYVLMGRTFIAEANFEEAVRLNRKAVELEPGNALSMAHLGEALVAAKQKEEGVAALKKAAAMDPDGAPGKMAKSWLTAIDAGLF